ncbi:hypothetical protein MUK42_02839 [Musa troglodytarum]|uniref:Uncharacterized protein n=1 Tax=Musa troglodytarum TaxID=320322 RepID=A0A9E7HEY7_9LILI|nr:hypothetical protein MUK42_02839 [Musa troglodytarum]
METGRAGAQKKPAISRTTAAAEMWALSAARRPIKVRSSTRDEIDRYWRMRRMIEEDHLLFAQKAAARIRAKALKGAAEEDDGRGGADGRRRRRKQGARDRNQGLVGSKPLTSALSSFPKTIE